MNKTIELQELFKEWKNRHQSLGKNQFIFDGIVNEARWNAAKPKICFLLKESYFDLDDYKNDILLPDNNDVKHHWNRYIANDDGLYTYDIARHLKEHKTWFMWCKVEKWLSSLYQILGMDIDAPIQEIALVNIKKSNGVSRSKDKDILDYAHMDCDMIRRELDIIDPDVIICGATYNYCIKENIFDDVQVIAKLEGFRNRVVAKSGKRLILDCYHPAAFTVSYEKIGNYFKAVGPYIHNEE